VPTVNSLAVSTAFATSAVSFEPLMSALLQCTKWTRATDVRWTCRHAHHVRTTMYIVHMRDGPHSVRLSVALQIAPIVVRRIMQQRYLSDICRTSSVTVESKCSGCGFYAVESIVGTLQRMTLSVARVLTAVPNCCCRLRLHEPARRMRPRSSRC
jgi:hypothetical protein